MRRYSVESIKIKYLHLDKLVGGGDITPSVGFPLITQKR